MIRLVRRIEEWWQAGLARQIVAPAVIVALLFLAALGFVAFQLGQRAVVVQVEARNRQLATQVGQEVNTFFQNQLDTLRFLEPQLLDTSDPARQTAALVTLRERFPYTYNDLSMFDAAGRETVVLTGTLSQVLQRESAPLAPSARAAVPPDVGRALQNGQISISPVAFRPITSSPYVTMTLPLSACTGAEACRPQMVLLAQIDLRSFWTKVDSMRIEGGSVSIVDQRGVILAHPERQRVGENVEQAAIAPVYQGYEGSTTYTQRGVTYLASYSPIGNLLGWGVIVEQQRDQALAPVRTIGLVATLATLLSALCLALLLSSIVRQTVRPVTALSESAAVIAASGDLRGEHGDYQVPRGASSEIAALADSFNHMIGRLSIAQADLQHWAESLEQRVLERTAQLRAVMEAARVSSGSLSEQEVLATILTQVERLVAYDTATIMLLDATGTALATVARSGSTEPLRRRIHSLDDFPLNRLVLEQRAPQIVRDTRQNPHWRPRPQEGEEQGSWLGVPLLVKEQAIGVMGLFKQRANFYGEEEAELVSALASQVAIALAHARLYEESVHRVERELHVARQVQRHLFPDRVPAATGLEVATFYRPAHETTGDFYAFVQPPPANGSHPGEFGLIIGDVSGKSLPAALLMAMARTALHTAARTHPAHPVEVLRTANSVLVGEMPRGSFVASSYGWFDRAAQACFLANAGQPAPLLARGGRVLMLEGTGSHLPLGVVAASAYDAMLVTLQPGDMLVFYTDGVIEAFNRRRELFGFERLEAVVQSCAGAPQAAIEQVMAAISTWMDGAHQHDDIALVVVQVTPDWV